MALKQVSSATLYSPAPQSEHNVTETGNHHKMNRVILKQEITSSLYSPTPQSEHSMAVKQITTASLYNNNNNEFMEHFPRLEVLYNLKTCNA